MLQWRTSFQKRQEFQRNGRSEQRTDLPASLDGVEVVAEGAGDDPDLREAELRRRRHLRRPHVQARLGAVELPPRHVPHRVLQYTTTKIRTPKRACQVSRVLA